MAVKVLAFFDARFRSRPSNGVTADAVWRSVLVPPLGQFQPPIGMPSAYGTYDLAVASQARHVIDAARAAGVDGFVIDCHKENDGTYGRDAEVFAAGVDGFEFGFRWHNETTVDLGGQRADAAAAMAAMAACAALRGQDRLVIVVNAVDHIADPAAFVVAVRAVAAASGLPRLYLIANRPADPDGALVAAGFDALVDPDPSEWPSGPPPSAPTGVDFFAVTAGLKDSAVIADSRFAYAAFVNSRLVDRWRRGKVLPRVFAAFSDWPRYPYGGSTTLVSGDLRLYRSFIERCVVHIAAAVPADEQIVFLESWNDRTRGSEIEPSTQAGDLVLAATRAGIERGRYVLRTAGAAGAVDTRRADELAVLCRRIAAEIAAEAKAAAAAAPA